MAPLTRRHRVVSCQFSVVPNLPDNRQLTTDNGRVAAFTLQ